MLDFVFPWHMQLGRFERNQAVDVFDKNDGYEEAGEKEDADGFAYTPFKTFNRRRNFLVWMLSTKFDKIFTPEERQLLSELESK